MNEGKLWVPPQERRESATVRPYAGTAENAVGKALRILAWITMICGLILGFTFGKDAYGEFSFGAALLYWVAGVVTGILQLGFAEIIRLLQTIASNSYRIYEVPKETDHD